MVVLSTAKSLAMTASVLMGAIQDCNDAQDLNKQIAGCSHYISSGQAEGENLVTAYVNRAIALSVKKQHKKALADFAAALKVEPQSWIALYNRGIVFFDLGRDEEAIRDFGAAIRSDPTTAIAYYNRGLAYERTGQVPQAVEDYRRAIELDPSDGNAKAHLEHLTAAPQG
jgi:tetratricopeptide (TPR) repeat protein